MREEKAKPMIKQEVVTAQDVQSCFGFDVSRQKILQELIDSKCRIFKEIEPFSIFFLF